ncbi:MAG: carboxypeptidase-like regulatory domain-containing protein, partial [Candidatus Acidiferrum sp.]
MGSVTDPTGALIPGAKVTLANPVAGFYGAVSSDQDGRYRFPGVPFGRFELTVQAPGFHETQYSGDLQTSGPLVVDVHFNSVESASVQIKVEDGDLEAATSSLTTLHGLRSEEMERMPIAPPNRALSAVVETVPGVVPEENGRLHIRGSEVQPQYVLDGVPLN